MKTYEYRMSRVFFFIFFFLVLLIIFAFVYVSGLKLLNLYTNFHGPSVSALDALHTDNSNMTL